MPTANRTNVRFRKSFVRNCGWWSFLLFEMAFVDNNSFFLVFSMLLRRFAGGFPLFGLAFSGFLLLAVIVRWRWRTEMGWDWRQAARMTECKSTCLNLMKMNCYWNERERMRIHMREITLGNNHLDDDELLDDEDELLLLLLLELDRLLVFFRFFLNLSSSFRFAMSLSSCSFSSWFNFWS
jgi:hypothetical protein